ncbi:hypothetical protein P4C99_08570 [Pontiellaceae bacterium B1224]|nr:hypothetical protein [Pontiellaceae bacterium B1224]
MLVHFSGKRLMWGALGLQLMLFGFQPLEAATFLGQSTNTRDVNDDDDEEEEEKGWFSLSTASSSEKSSSKETVQVVSGGTTGSSSYWKDLQEEVSADVPEDWLPNRLRTSFEIGLQHWEPISKSGQYTADYDIDPVTVTTLDASVRVKSWVFMMDYKTSLTDPENMKNLLAQVSRITPGEGMWWSLYVEKGHVEGSAKTEDALGNPVEYGVDTEWNRIGIELRTYRGIYGGLVWEDLSMPAIHTFNNENIAFAVFDDQTQARTLSLAIGYDKARYLMNNFEEGGAWAWALEGSIGLGWLSYSEDEARDFIEAQGYDFNSNNFLIAGAIDGRLGYTYSKEFWGCDTQCFVGGRLRASGWMNWVGDDTESDTLDLDTGFGLITPGIFARFSLQW